jgi:hypothetical protein
MNNSCCMIPNYKLPKREPCKNNSVCYKFEEKGRNGFCLDCIENIPFDNKLLELKENSDCDVCLKEDSCCVKRLHCEHYLCIQCFRKIYFNKDLHKPVFPYLNQTENDLPLYENIDDLNITNYKKSLEYWNHLQNISYKNKINCCNQN